MMAYNQTLTRHGLILCLLLLVPFFSFSQEAPAPGVRITDDTVTLIQRLDTAWNMQYGSIEKAEAINRYCLEQSRKLGFSYGAGRSLGQLGFISMAKGEYDESFRLYVEALAYLYQTERGKREVPGLLTNLGDISYYRGDYGQAMRYHLKALEIATDNYPDMNVDYIYINLAGDLAQTGRSPESMDYYLSQAEQMSFRFKNYASLSKIYNNKGFGYMPSKQWERCFYYFRKGLAFGRAAGNQEMEYVALLNLGVVWMEMGKLDSALVYMEQACKGAELIPAAAREHLEATLGRAYLMNGQTDKAMPLLQKQYREAVASGNKISLRVANYNMSKLYGSQGNYKDAYLRAWDYININDSIGGSDVVDEVSNMEVAYRTAEKEKRIANNRLQIARQEKELEQKNKWIVIIIGIVSLLLMLSLLLRARYKTLQKFLEKNMQAMKQLAEIETLKATIKGEEQERVRLARELHDGLGAMTAAARINLGVLDKEQLSPDSQQTLQRTTQLLDEISTDLRATAHNMMPRALMERNLPEAVNTFCEHIRSSKGLDIEVETFGHFEALPDLYLLSTYRIVQELVHNAQKHANATRILVQLSFRDKLLLITVEDNGSGFDVQTKKEQSGIGLDSIQGRVQSLGGTLTVHTEKDKGTSIEVEILTSAAAA